jgi:hypothetical protein
MPFGPGHIIKSCLVLNPRLLVQCIIRGVDNAKSLPHVSTHSFPFRLVVGIYLSAWKASGTWLILMVMPVS